ncbi:uncharacterized protein LOC128396090 isoform X2 [Panonychus citri]|uniref:uncharacterized protein LOC128396090 isoform X2 n=1 Tax=Panonychus citri TaxID=50023 RepID=UPI002307C6AF|nr:uncharacterized protein LOC128396090 isoform X2 [Panonychus citri]
MDIQHKVPIVNQPMFYYSRLGRTFNYNRSSDNQLIISPAINQQINTDVDNSCKSKGSSLIATITKMCNFKLIKLHQSRCIELGLSFFALILLMSKFYDVNREVNYLKYISNNWLSSSSSSSSSSAGALHRINNNQTSTSTIVPNELQLNSANHQIEILKQDLAILIGELWSSRTTLLLSVIFVIVYILSWIWMSYTVQEDHTSKDISVKTILLLTVFAVVDIAASAGFVLVRIVMYALRNRNFPMEMRLPFVPGEHNQLTAFVALRLTTLKSSSGTTDIFVVIIIGILTLLRLYSVMCAVSFYNKARKSDPSYYNKKPMTVLESINSGRQQPHPPHPPPPIPDTNGFLPRVSNVLSKSQSNSSLKERIEVNRRFSVTGSTMSEEEINRELKIQAADMSPLMQRSAVESALQALRLYNTEKHIAESIKQDFDRIFEPTWHCIVGRNWGSCVTHTKKCYVRMICRDLTILLYKST